LQQFLEVSNIALVFLTAVLASAVAYGLGPSLFACLISVLRTISSFCRRFTPFTIAAPENIVALFFLPCGGDRQQPGGSI
jgi:two-component system sensor histidine kinase KdpD